LSRQPVLLGWQLSDKFGWGIVGLNLFRAWARGSEIAPLMALPITAMPPADDDPPWMDSAVAQSNRMAAEIARLGQGEALRVKMPVVAGLANDLDGILDLTGSRTIGRAVFENIDLKAVAGRLERYDALTCISEWNAAMLRTICGKPVEVILEAIDHRLFHPGPRTGLLPTDRFHIFSGGKVEFRKGQDLVLLAFREFSRRHDDAVLVTAWHSPWPQRAEGFQGKLDAALKRDADGNIDVLRWVAENGIDASKVIDLGPMPNREMPRWLREMDCALQPSRAEGGTNMVAMEAMGCAVPVIVGRNTGLLDLIQDGNCLALERQGPVAGVTMEGWGESDVEEILDALEAFHASKELRQRIGGAGHAFMQTRSWAGHADALKHMLWD
jgi:glycosyltransferase involved in cell wall biosynthesis